MQNTPEEYTLPTSCNKDAARNAKAQASTKRIHEMKNRKIKKKINNDF
jgi:hypothetical protein